MLRAYLAANLWSCAIALLIMSTQHNFKKARPDLVPSIRRLCELKSGYNFLFILVDYVLIAVAIALSLATQNACVYLLAICVIGSRMRAFDNLLHEASHGLLFKGRRTNYFAGLVLCAFPIGSSMFAYKKSHLSHHVYLGDPARDPDLQRYRKIGLTSHPYNRSQLVKKLARVVLMLDTLGYLRNTFSAFIYVKGAPYKESILRALYYAITAGLVYYFELGTCFVLYWIVPFLTTFQIIRFFAEISEHGGLYEEPSEILMTRNNLLNPILRTILFHMEMPITSRIIFFLLFLTIIYPSVIKS